MLGIREIELEKSSKHRKYVRFEENEECVREISHHLDPEELAVHRRGGKSR